MDEIKIKTNKKKLIFLFFGSIILAFFSLWYILYPSDFVNIITRRKELIYIVGIIGSVVFGISSIWIFFRLFDNKPGLIINEQGIIDNTNTGSIGLIKWQDIIEVRHKRIMSNSIMLIVVKEPQKYLQGVSILKRLSLKQNINNYGTPIALTSVSLDCNFDELEKRVNDAFSLMQKINNNFRRTNTSS